MGRVRRSRLRLFLAFAPFVFVAWSAVAAMSATGDLTLSPTSASHPAGSSHTVTATLSSGGRPVSGATVTFSVTSGPDAGAGGSGVTGGAGQTTFTFTNNGALGTDSILATSGGSSANATVTWVDTTPPVVSVPGDFTVEATGQ